MSRSATASITRFWIADNANDVRHQCKYPVTDTLTLTGFIVNGLITCHPNDQPVWRSLGLQGDSAPHLDADGVWRAGSRPTRRWNWRFYANHIVEWKGEDLTLAASYDIGTEAVADRPEPRGRLSWVAMW